MAGHGPAFRDTRYLDLVIGLLDSSITQVHAALERAAVTAADVGREMRLDGLERRFTGGDPEVAADFREVRESLFRKIYLERVTDSNRGAEPA